jgi:hypothetical protein
MVAFDPETMRLAMEGALPGETSFHGQAPEPRYLFVPLRHAQALSPDHGLVVGIRGAGKSVWWAALQSENHRGVVQAALPGSALSELSAVSAGFGETPRPDEYPDKHTNDKLLRNGLEPVHIWRTVVAWSTWGQGAPTLAGLPGWDQRVAWVQGHPEETAHAFKVFDDGLAASGSKHLILFDALERSSSTWDGLRRLLRGLLEVLLEFRAYRALRVKAFVRPDMLDDPAVTSFRDASKVIAGKVELRWARADLYGLLFQYLGNAPQGRDFRQGSESLGGGRWATVQGIWQVPKAMREDEDLQRRIFDEIAGQWMGRSSKRGFTYSWLPNHLADAANQVSPRSFLAAVRTAAETSRGHSGHHAFHYEGIKTGVQEASRIRVDEVKEDFPWVPVLMEPLKGLVIPCDFAEIAARWEAVKIWERVGRELPEGALPPKHLEEGVWGLRKDLLDLALFSLQRDERINMPDVYRVGFGLGRRGGVKPIR